MEKRTQPRLSWEQRDGGWIAAAGKERFLTVSVWVFDTTIEITDRFEAVVETWFRDYPGRWDLVDAMIFAEDRALELCKAMFGKLVEVANA